MDINLLDADLVSVTTANGSGPALLGARCGSCGTFVFPRMPICPSCLIDGSMEDVEFGQTAVLYSHTIAHFAPGGFEAPYFQAFVELYEGPRVFTLIGSVCPVESGVLKDGMVMRLIVEPLTSLPENRDKWTYKYVPEAFVQAAGGDNRA